MTDLAQWWQLEMALHWLAHPRCTGQEQVCKNYATTSPHNYVPGRMKIELSLQHYQISNMSGYMYLLD
jgi:hypothetical protein